MAVQLDRIRPAVAELAGAVAVVAVEQLAGIDSSLGRLVCDRCVELSSSLARSASGSDSAGIAETDHLFAAAAASAEVEESSLHFFFCCLFFYFFFTIYP